MTTATKTAIGAAAAVALVAGCSTAAVGDVGSSHARPFNVRGSVLLAKRYEVTWGRKYPLCAAKGNNPFAQRADGAPHTPFDDVKDGARVLVTDAAGNTLGVGSLMTGHSPDGQHCTFGFDVAVPSGLRSYLVAVAGHTAQQFSEAQLHHRPTVELG